MRQYGLTTYAPNYFKITINGHSKQNHNVMKSLAFYICKLF